MWLDVSAIVLLLVFAGLGAFRGGLASGLGLASLGLGYGAAILSAEHLGPTVATRLGWPLAGPAVAGTAAFLLAMVVCGGVGWGIRKLLADEGPTGPVSRALGAFFGGLRGLLIVLLLSWLAIWVDAGRAAGALEVDLPPIEGSGMADFTSAVVEATVTSALDEGPGTAVVARLASRPGMAVESLQVLLADPRIEALQRDGFFWTLVENRAVQRAMYRSSYRAIARDPQMRLHLAEIGMISPEAALEPASFDRAIAPVLEQVGPRIKGLRDDPELRALANDPEIVAMLESGDTLGLVRHERFQRLVSRVARR